MPVIPIEQGTPEVVLSTYLSWTSPDSFLLVSPPRISPISLPPLLSPFNFIRFTVVFEVSVTMLARCSRQAARLIPRAASSLPSHLRPVPAAIARPASQLRSVSSNSDGQQHVRIARLSWGGNGSGIPADDVVLAALRTPPGRGPHYLSDSPEGR